MSFLKSSTVVLALLSASSNAFAVPPTAYQWGYNLCVSELFLHEIGKNTEKFMLKREEEKAKQCLAFLKKKYPNVAAKIDYKTFQQGFVDGSYRQSH